MEFYNRKVKFIYKKDDINPEDVFIDSLAEREEDDFYEKKFEVPLSRNVPRIFLIIIFILIAIIFFTDFKFQTLDSGKFLAQAQKNKFIFQKIKAERGIIYDKNFNQLVFNQPSFDLVVEKNDLPKGEERKKTLKEVSAIIGKRLEDVEAEIDGSKESKVAVLENIDHQTLLILETKISGLKGFSVENNTVRGYSDGEIFSPILGYLRKTGEKTGVESYYDDVLKEKPGEILGEKNAKGDLLSQKIVSSPESGRNLMLWLDSDLQKKVYQEIKMSMEKNGAKVGAGVVLDAKSGGVLAMVSFPGFDNNLFSKGMSAEDWAAIQQNPENPLLNQSISGAYQTGSVIKPLLSAAALEEKIISPETQIDCHGYIEIKNKYNPEIVYRYNDWKVHGLTNMRKAIGQSSNVYFYTIGGGYKDREGLGPTRIKKWLQLFGWGNKTGIDIPGESDGFLPDPDWKKEKMKESWTDGNTYHYSIGQEFIKVTPLQVAVSILPFANGGKLLKPKVAKGILDADKNLAEEFNPEVVRENFVDEDNLKVVQEGMRQAVTNGSCTDWLNSLPFKVGCKTGTSQIGKIDPADGKDFMDAWVMVFAPYEDPEIVLTFLVREVKKAHGAILPPTRAVLEWYFSRNNQEASESQNNEPQNLENSQNENPQVE